MPELDRMLERVANVVPDRLDLRDRVFMPSPDTAPPASKLPPWSCDQLPVLDQGRSYACTGFALASVIRVLQLGAEHFDQQPVSPYMLYDMARRYDAFPGEEDVGSSLRGALKGWYKHGACSAELWRELAMPERESGAVDWWYEAALRPMGAYYRVDKASVVDIQLGLAQVGVLYASALYHDGWSEGLAAGTAAGGDDLWVIPQRERNPFAGHAFAIIGYTPNGFVIQNSYGPQWGSHGRAILSYQDWLDNGMDVWVAQLGVVTGERQAVAGSMGTLRSEAREGRSAAVTLSSDVLLANKEIDDFIVNVENNGRLSRSGQFRSTELDLDVLVNQHLPRARERWGRTEGPIDVAIYAHGGLTGELDAAKTARKWIPALYNAAVLPVFLMWETDIFSTLRNRIEDLVVGETARAGGFLQAIDELRLRTIECTVRPFGKLLWDEMKQNAGQIVSNPESGLQLLLRRLWQAGVRGEKLRLHLIGHSAGAIVHTLLAEHLAERGVAVESMVLMAGAVRLDELETRAVPYLRSGLVKRLVTLNLTEELERSDASTRLVLGYDRSLLYLVSNAFEARTQTPLVGLEEHLGHRAARWQVSPGSYQRLTTAAGISGARHHGDFATDDQTRRTVVGLIAQQVERSAGEPIAPLAHTGERRRSMAPPAGATTVEVHARRRWNPTGVHLEKGARYRFTVDRDDDWHDWFVRSGPEGYELPLLRPLERYLRVPAIKGRKLRFFTLVGTIGKCYRHAFEIDTSTVLHAPADGQLYCFANDLGPMYWNNRGSLILHIERLDDDAPG